MIVDAALFQKDSAAALAGEVDTAMREAIDQASNMAGWRAMFTVEELLAQLLQATRLALLASGVEPSETERARLSLAIDAYIDVPPAPPRAERQRQGAPQESEFNAADHDD